MCEIQGLIDICYDPKITWIYSTHWKYTWQGSNSRFALGNLYGTH